MKTNLFCLLFISFFILSCRESIYLMPVFSNKSIEKSNFSISELKNLSTRQRYQIRAAHIIKGQITANDKGGNFYREIYIQDQTGGLTIRIVLHENEQTHSNYPIGGQLRILTQGLHLEKRNEEVQLGSVNQNNQFVGILHPAKHFSIEKETSLIQAKELKIEELNDELIGSLVEIKNLSFDNKFIGNSFFSQHDKGNFKIYTLKDCQGKKIGFLVNKAANFKDKLIPGDVQNIKGILTKYNKAYQLKIRDLSDIKATQEKCPEDIEGKKQELNRELSQIIEIKNKTNEIELENTESFKDKKLELQSLVGKIKEAIEKLQTTQREEIAKIEKLIKEAKNKANEYEKIILSAKGLEDKKQEFFIKLQTIEKSYEKIKKKEKALKDSTKAQRSKQAAKKSIEIAKNAIEKLSTLRQNTLRRITRLIEEAFAKVGEYENQIKQIEKKENENLIAPPEEPSINENYKELIFSQYIRLRGSEKYLAIYNGTDKEIDLSSYEIERVIGPRTKHSESLSGILYLGKILILKHPKAKAYQKKAQDFDEEVMNFGGNNQILLKKENDILDQIGSTNWLHSRGNKNLRRKKGKGPTQDYENSEWNEIEEATANNLETFENLDKAP